MLDTLGLTEVKTVIYNPDYAMLFAHETADATEPEARGVVTSLGAVAIDTGRFTGRSPKDKYIVKEPATEKHVWWHEQGSDNKPLTKDNWEHLKGLATQQLSGKTLYVIRRHI